jgi:hypothetical protein
VMVDTTIEGHCGPDAESVPGLLMPRSGRADVRSPRPGHPWASSWLRFAPFVAALAFFVLAVVVAPRLMSNA